jgi:hypothetical protein
VVSRSDYGEREVEACRSVLLELVHILGEFKDHMIIIGGWVPAFLFPRAEERHVGSLDIDVALDFKEIPDDSYQTILTSLLKNGYVQDPRQPFRFYRKMATPDDSEITVEIDLMAGEYGGTGRGRRTQKVQNARARKARGCDLAFTDSVTVALEGGRPGGGRDRTSFQVAGIVPFLVMKGMALFDRMKEKDAYDIYYCIEHSAGGPVALAEEFTPSLKSSLVREGLAKIRSKFASIGHIGPKWVADFLENTDKEEREIVVRRAYEKAAELLDLLGVKEWGR